MMKQEFVQVLDATTVDLDVSPISGEESKPKDDDQDNSEQKEPKVQNLVTLKEWTLS